MRTTDASSVVCTAVARGARRATRTTSSSIATARASSTSPRCPGRRSSSARTASPSLGEGIAIVRDGERRRRGRRTAAGATCAARSCALPDGDAALLRDASRTATRVASQRGRDARRRAAEERAGRRASRTTSRAGSIELHPLAANALAPVDRGRRARPRRRVGGDRRGRGRRRSTGSRTTCPCSSPSSTAARGARVDSGLRLESDRLLVRVVGFGGTP